MTQFLLKRLFDSNIQTEEIQNNIYANETNAFQSAAQINEMTKDSPFTVFLNLGKGGKRQYISLLVPANTAYLYVCNGQLYSTPSPVYIQHDKIKKVLKMMKEATKIMTGESGETEQAVFTDICKNNDLDSMEYVYIHEDIGNIQFVAQLDEGGFIPRVFVVDKWSNALQVDIAKMKKDFSVELQEVWCNNIEY